MTQRPAPGLPALRAPAADEVRLPRPRYLLPPGGVLAVGGVLGFAYTSGLWCLAWMPVISAGLTLFSLGVVSGIRRLLASGRRRARLAHASVEHVEPIAAFLTEHPQGATVLELSTALNLTSPQVILALGHLDRRGELDEEMDERLGNFRYRYTPQAAVDAESHLSLQDRIKRTQGH